MVSLSSQSAWPVAAACARGGSGEIRVRGIDALARVAAAAVTASTIYRMHAGLRGAWRKAVAGVQDQTSIADRPHRDSASAGS